MNLDPRLPELASHLLAGVPVGLAYFHSLRWNATLFASAAPLRTVLAVMFVRFAALAAVLAVVAIEGAAPLLSMTVGVFAGRAIVLRRARREPR